MAADFFYFSKDGSPDASRGSNVARHGRLGRDLEFLGIHKHVACHDGGHDAAFDYSNFVAASDRLPEENSTRLRRHLRFCTQLFSGMVSEWNVLLSGLCFHRQLAKPHPWLGSNNPESSGCSSDIVRPISMQLAETRVSKTLPASVALHYGALA